jgi:hypothetical protein
MVAACASCYSAPPYGILHGDLAFTDEERASIERATDTLRTQTGISIEVVWDGTDHPHSIFRSSATTGHSCGIASFHGHMMLYPNLPCGTYSTVEAIMLHELVHYIGDLDHLPKGVGLMSPVISWPKPCLDEQSWKMLAEHMAINGTWCDRNGRLMTTE